MDEKITKRTHLLICFVEEISELMELSFLSQTNQGWDYIYEDKKIKDLLEEEYADLIGVGTLLQEDGIDFFTEVEVTEANLSLGMILSRLQKMIFKSMRFGFFDSYPDSPITNFGEICIELKRLDILIKRDFNFDESLLTDRILAKQTKVNKFLDYAYNKDMLHYGKEINPVYRKDIYRYFNKKEI